QVVARGDADLVGRALLVADVDLGGRVLADQDDRQRGLRARPLPQHGDAGLHLGQDLRRDLFAAENQHRPAQPARGTRRRSMDSPRPVSGSMRITAPWSMAGPLAGSKRFGIPERKRARASSGSTPMTESVGPVSPRSVM